MKKEPTFTDILIKDLTYAFKENYRPNATFVQAQNCTHVKSSETNCDNLMTTKMNFVQNLTSFISINQSQNSIKLLLITILLIIGK